MQRVHIALSTDSLSRHDLIRIARRADALGYGGLWLTEFIGRDAFGVLTEIALATDRIALGTGIVNVYGRSPAVLAQSAIGLSEATQGRPILLGLGTSGRGLVEKIHGQPYVRPVSRLRETVSFLRTALGPDSPLAVRPPGPVDLVVAGLSPSSMQIAAEADGWLPIWFDPREVSTAPHPRITAYTYTAVDDRDPQAARGLVRRSAAWYLAANGTAYANLFRRRGFAAEVDRIVELWRAGDRAGARAAVPDELLDSTATAGTTAQVGNRVEVLLGVGVTNVALRFPDELPANEIIRTLDVLGARWARRCPPPAPTAHHCS